MKEDLEYLIHNVLDDICQNPGFSCFTCSAAFLLFVIALGIFLGIIAMIFYS